MKAPARLPMLIAAPLVLMDLGLFVVAWFLMVSALIFTSEVSLWFMTLVATASAALYAFCLYFIAADALQFGAGGLRTPRRLLRCSLFGLATNAMAALLAYVVLMVTLVLAGGIF